jgi:hypothetical protein
MKAHDYHLDIFFDNLKLKVYFPIHESNYLR